MIARPRALVAEPSTWLAVLICVGLCALAWFGYRATDQWQRSAALLADHRGHEAADLLTRALTRDMYGVQTSILNSPEQNRRAFDPPYDANDLVALAFARYPYPEFFSPGHRRAAERSCLREPIGCRHGSLLASEPMSIQSRCGAIRRNSRRCGGGCNQISPQAGVTRCSIR